LFFQAVLGSALREIGRRKIFWHARSPFGFRGLRAEGMSLKSKEVIMKSSVTVFNVLTLLIQG